MLNYLEGKIYKVIKDGIVQPYIGSTVQTLEVRFYTHQHKYNNGIKSTISLIEDYPCNSKLELLKRERYWIEWYKERGGVLNKHMPSRSNKESKLNWMRSNKEHLKKYKEINKDKIRDYYNIYREDKNIKFKNYYKHYNDRQRYIKTVMIFPII